MKKLLFMSFVIFVYQCSYAQQIVSVKPNCGNADETLDVTITGKNTNFSQINGSSTTVRFVNYLDPYEWQPDISINSINIIDDISISANITIQSTAVSNYLDLVFNEYNSEYGKRDAFFINAPLNPEIISVSPDTVNAGSTLDVTITGRNTDFISTTGSGTSIGFDGYFYNGSGTININSINTIDDNILVANVTVSSLASSSYHYLVYNYFNDYKVFKEDAIYVNAPENPQILSLNPNSGIPGQTLDVTITGRNTHFTQIDGSNTTFNFYPYFYTYLGSGTTDIDINSINVINDEELLTNITISPLSSIGYRNLEYYGNIYYNPDIGIRDAFYVGPYLNSVFPDFVYQNRSVSLTFEFTNTNFDLSNENSIDLWLSNNNNGCEEELYPEDIVVNDTNLLKATFNIPANMTAGYWNANILASGIAYIYRDNILQVKQFTSVNNIHRYKQIIKAFPNPFSSTITLEYFLKNNSKVIVELFDVYGKKITTISNRYQTAGNYNQSIHGKKLNLSFGIYIIKISINNNSYLKKIIYQEQ